MKKGQGHPARRDPRVYDGLWIGHTVAGQVLIGVGPHGREPVAMMAVCPGEVEGLVRELRDVAAMAGEAHA